MTSVVIRQSGGANIVSIPKAIVSTLNLHIGSKLDLSIRDNTIVLTPVYDTLTLEELLAGCSNENFVITNEDREWLDTKPVGKEIL